MTGRGRLPAALTALAWLTTAALTGCSSPASPGGSAGQEPTGTLTVFAAASLKSTFTELAGEYERQHPGVQVSLSFDGSSSLATQIIAGAPADVFAAADQPTMDRVKDSGLLRGGPATFAANTMTLVVPPGNRANITSFADAVRPGVKLVVCAPQVPCGAAAAADAANAGLSLQPVSEELSVGSVLSKVTSQEADAGLVYVTDAKSAGAKVEEIALGVPNPARNSYPIAAVETRTPPELAQGFIELVMGAQGRAVLQEAGFDAP